MLRCTFLTISSRVNEPRLRSISGETKSEKLRMVREALPDNI
jgi:hypothetical protein